ncbi:D-aminoacyl-tRNA deacylase [Acidaminobacterium chupaoyuni]
MRTVITRVTRAELTIEGRLHAKIGKGFLVLVGITGEDTEKEATYLAEKCVGLRVFEDENGKMNRALADVGGEILAVSNFTLYANCAHGRRPDFLAAAKPDHAVPIYEFFLSELRRLGAPLQSGVFGADMQIDHVNDGPVTILMDTAEMMKKERKAEK